MEKTTSLDGTTIAFDQVDTERKKGNVIITLEHDE